MVGLCERTALENTFVEFEGLYDQNMVNGHVFMAEASHTVIVDFGCGNSLDRDGLRQTELYPRNTMIIGRTLIPDRSQPGITMTASTVRHRDVGDKYDTVVTV